MQRNNQPINKQGSANVARGMQATAKLYAILATVTLLSSIVPLVPSSHVLFATMSDPPPVETSTPLLSLSHPLSNCPTSSTPAFTNCPALSTLASPCVIHCPIAFRSVLHPTPLAVLFAARSPHITCHLLVSYSTNVNPLETMENFRIYNLLFRCCSKRFSFFHQ